MSSNAVEELRPEFNVVFSDDIRQEVDGKMTLVGTYNLELVFPELPAFHPKLGIYIIGKIPQEGLKSVKIITERNNEILLETNAPVPPENLSIRHQRGQDLPTGMRLFTAATVLPPMTFIEPCTIRAKVEVNGITYVAGKLHISRAEPEEKNASKG